ncbi:MAG: hypothetical protein Q7J85_00680 [Bacillota bacterium]|nr:hypothetical protein [Bacillota bacterium]
MLFEHELVYNFEKFNMITVLLTAIILTSVLVAYTLCANLSKEEKNSLLFLHGLVLAIQTGHFLAIVSPPREFVFFIKLQYVSICLLGPAFYLYLHVALLKYFLRRLYLAALCLVPGACCGYLGSFVQRL